MSGMLCKMVNESLSSTQSIVNGLDHLKLTALCLKLHVVLVHKLSESVSVGGR